MTTFLLFLSATGIYLPLFSIQTSMSFEMSGFMITLWLVFISVFLWSFYYAGSYKDFISYSFLSLLFVYSMALLMVSKNAMSLLMGWDGLGCTSFLLICHFMNWTSKLSAMVVVLSNKVGDALLIWAVGFSTVYSTFDTMALHSTGSFLLLICCLTKAAQFPFMSWLPLSMNAPTTTSALVHSSTLVCAGVILLSKTQTLSNMAMSFWSVFMSIFVAGMCALIIFDMKKLVAFSTLSQMSFLILLISMNCHTVAILHMIVHAFIKSSLFMGVGNLIHTSTHQNWVFMKHNYSLVNTTLMFINCLTLSGMSLIGSSLTKDLSYDTLMASSTGSVALILTSLFVGLTTTYSMKLCFMTSKSCKWVNSNMNSEMWQTGPIIIPTMVGMMLSGSISSALIGSPISYKSFQLQTMFIASLFSFSMMAASLFISKSFNTILHMDTLTLKTMSTFANKAFSQLNETMPVAFKWGTTIPSSYVTQSSVYFKLGALSMVWITLMCISMFFYGLSSALNFGLSGNGSFSMM